MKIAVIPRFAELLEGTVFKYNKYTPLQLYGVDRPGFSALNKYLSSQGNQIATIDQYEIAEPDLYLFIDMNYYYLNRILEHDPTAKLVYMMREPPTSEPFNTATTLQMFLPLFDRVLTWNDNLVTEHDRFVGYKLPYCHSETRYDGVKSFNDRKLLVNISSRKYSSHPNELYSARKRVIKFYERHYPDQFTLYGRGWNDPPRPMEMYRGNIFPERYSCYEGLVEDKIHAYHNHRFALSFENISSISGYISEKLFDCFRAGTVPVYWGASNITEYIPEESFIDYREFTDISDLHEYLASMSESTYEEYLEAGQSFLASDHRFGAETFAEEVGKALLSTPNLETCIPEDLREMIKERAHLDRMTYNPTTVPRTEFVKRWVELAKLNPKMLVETPQATYFMLRRLLPGSLGDIR